MAIAYIGLGSNLGDRAGNIETALDHLREQSGSPRLGALALFRLELRFLAGQIRERLRVMSRLT